MHSGSLAGRSNFVIVERGGGVKEKEEVDAQHFQEQTRIFLLFFDLRNSPKNSLTDCGSQLDSLRTFHVSWLVAKNVCKVVRQVNRKMAFYLTATHWGNKIKIGQGAQFLFAATHPVTKPSRVTSTNLWWLASFMKELKRE